MKKELAKLHLGAKSALLVPKWSFASSLYNKVELREPRRDT